MRSEAKCVTLLGIYFGSFHGSKIIYLLLWSITLNLGMSTECREKMLRRKAKSQNHKGLPTKMISIHHSFHYYLLSFPPLFLLLLHCAPCSFQCHHPFRSFLGSSDVQESICNAGDPVSIPGSGRFAGEGKGYPLQYSWASLVAQLVKNPPAMWETWVRSLGWEDTLEKGTATHSSILAWRIPWAV